MDTRGETQNGESSSTTIIMEDKARSLDECPDLNHQTSVQVPPRETSTPDSSCRDASVLRVPPALVPVHHVQIRTSLTGPSVTLTPSLPPSNQSTTRTRTSFRSPRQTESTPRTGMRTTGSFLTGFIISGVVLIISSVSMFTSGNSHPNGILTMDGDKIYQSANYYRILAPVFLTLGITLVIAGMVLSFRYCGYFKRQRSRSEEDCQDNAGFNYNSSRGPRVIRNSGRYPSQDLFGQIPYNHPGQTTVSPPPPSYWEAPPPYSEAVTLPERY